MCALAVGGSLGCSPSSPSPGARNRESSTPAETNRSARSAAASAGAVEFTGTVFSRSDVANRLDQPYRSGVVVAIPAAHASRVPAAASALNSPPVEGPHGATFTETDAQEARAALAKLATNGNFAMALPPGIYVIGLGNLGQPSAEAGTLPATIYGWVKVPIHSSPTQRVNLFFEGEAGAISLR